MYELLAFAGLFKCLRRLALLWAREMDVASETARMEATQNGKKSQLNMMLALTECVQSLIISDFAFWMGISMDKQCDDTCRP